MGVKQETCIFANKGVNDRAVLIIKDYIKQKEIELGQKQKEYSYSPGNIQIKENICVLEQYISEMKRTIEDIGYSNVIDIYFNEEDVHRKLKEYDLSFLEIAVNHASFKGKYFRELVKKWRLISQIGNKDNRDDHIITYYNDEYSLALTGLNENMDDIPFWYMSLTFSKNMKPESIIEFIRDFTDSLDYYDCTTLAIGINQNYYISHIKYITKKMLENLERPKYENYIHLWEK